MNPTLNPLEHFKECLPFLLKEKALLIKFWLVFSFFGLFSFWYRQGMNENEAQMTQVAFELILVFVNVFFLHALNLRKQGLSFGAGKIIGEGILLTFGFILQTVFWFLATLIGGLLLVVPGILAMVVFYLAPMIAVIYPDYQGKIFFLTKDLFWPHFFKTFILVFIFGGLIPFMPSLVHLGVTGQMESQLSYGLIPLSSFLYLLSEGCLFEYAFAHVSNHRQKQQAGVS